MVNLTEDENHITDQDLFCSKGLGIRQKIFISAFNIPLSTTAFLGNVLIIVALQKVSSVHPPSKLLLGCLASTDLCVGLISQPLYVAYKMFQGHSKPCHYLRIIFYTKGSMFCAISLLTLTAISVDRLLALLLGLRYRQVVTMKKVQLVVVSFWLFSAAVAMTVFFNFFIALSIACIVLLLCIVISTFCYMKIYFTLRHHQTQVQDHVHHGQPNGGGIVLNIARYRKTNPFLYCWKMREVRQAVKETIRQFCCFSS